MCMASPVTPPHPSFQGEEEIKEIPDLDIKKLITEGIGSKNGQLARDNQDQKDRRDIDGQTDCEVIGQTDLKIQIDLSSTETVGAVNPTLDLDGDVDMQGGEEGRVVHTPHPMQEDLEEQIQPVPPQTWGGENPPIGVAQPHSLEKEIIMQEGARG